MTAAQARDADGIVASIDGLDERARCDHEQHGDHPCCRKPEIVWRTRRMISVGADAELAVDMATG